MEEEDEIISEVPKPITQNDTYIDEDDEMIQRLIDKLNGIRLMIDEDVSKVKEREWKKEKIENFRLMLIKKRKRNVIKELVRILKNRFERLLLMKWKREIKLKRFYMLCLYKNMLAMKFRKNCILDKEERMIIDGFNAIKIYSKRNKLRRILSYSLFINKVNIEKKKKLQLCGLIVQQKNVLQIRRELFHKVKNDIQIIKKNQCYLMKIYLNLIRHTRKKSNFYKKQNQINTLKFYSRVLFKLINQKRKIDNDCEIIKKKKITFHLHFTFILLHRNAKILSFQRNKKQLLSQKTSKFKQDNIRKVLHYYLLHLIKRNTLIYFATNKDALSSLDSEAKLNQNILHDIQDKYNSRKEEFNKYYKILQLVKEKHTQLQLENNTLRKRIENDKIKFQEIYSQNIQDINSKNIIYNRHNRFKKRNSN